MNCSSQPIDPIWIVLSNYLTGQSPDCRVHVHYGSSLETIEMDKQKATFTSGPGGSPQTAKYDLLIAADGRYSKACRLIADQVCSTRCPRGPGHLFQQQYRFSAGSAAATLCNGQHCTSGVLRAILLGCCSLMRTTMQRRSILAAASRVQLRAEQPYNRFAAPAISAFVINKGSQRQLLRSVSNRGDWPTLL